MPKITVYKQNSCNVCKELVPLLSKLSKKKGIPLEIIDVDKCGKKCDSIKYIPRILIDGREVKSMKELEKVFGVK